jgi:hypothetical protein
MGPKRTPAQGPEPEETRSWRSSRPPGRPWVFPAICFAVLALGLAGPLATGTARALTAPGRAAVVAAAFPPQAAPRFQTADGAGTMTVSPASVPASGITTLTFTYTAAAIQNLKLGSIALDVPPGWTPPALSGPGAIKVACLSAAPCNVAQATVSVSGQRVTIGRILLGTSQALTITYAEATVPASGGPATFNAFEQSTTQGSLIGLNPSPGEMVTCADGVGTVTVSPGSVAASSTRKLVFTYTPPGGCVVEGGTVSLTVPPGWTPPSATPGAAGYVASSPGAQSLSVSGNAITVTGVTLAAGQAVILIYHKATAPGSATTSTFAATEQSAGAGKLAALLSSPQVTVRPPVATSSPTPAASTGPSPTANGGTGGTAPGQTTGARTGTMTVSPITVTASRPGRLTFTYRAPARGLAPSGEVTLLVPPGWTPPSPTPGKAGYTTSRPGAVSVSGRRITVTGAALGPGQSLVITYRPTAAPQAAGTSFFAASERAGTINVLTALASSPSVMVAGPAPFHVPIQLVLVLLAAACVAAASAIRFLRHRQGPVSPPNVQALPHPGPPGTVSVQPGRTGATHAVSIEPHPGAPVMTVEETRR